MNKHNFSMINKEVWANNNINHENHGYDSINSGRDNPSIYKTLSIEPNFALSEWGKYIENEVDLKKFIECTTFLLTEEISFEQNSEWNNLDIYPNMGAMGNLTAMGGVGEGLGSVMRSKQYWKNSGYIKLNPKVRLIDWNGEGLCEKMALILSAYTVPLFHADVEHEAGRTISFIGDKISSVGGEEGVGKFIKLIGESTEKVGEFLKEGKLTGKAQEGFTEIINATGAVDSAVLGGMGNISKEIIEAISDYITLRMSPPVLKVRVGSIFHHEEMILKSFNVTFSKEFTKNGPLYADVNLTLESRKVVRDISDTGLFTKPPNYNKNISIVNEDLTKEEESSRVGAPRLDRGSPYEVDIKGGEQDSTSVVGRPVDGVVKESFDGLAIISNY